MENNYLSLKDKQVSQEEFEKFTGKSLKLYLGLDESSARAFIYRKQLSCDSFLDANFFSQPDYSWKKFNNYQRMHYKLGVIEQILFELRNGELTTDSGYNGDIGAVVHADYLDYISFSREAKRHFELCGLWNRKIEGENIINFGGYYD